mmetsp:Transcript_64710/g.193338  ORF Transcript_64710/g.193338 Transcript_64710/m.193338 type:complete len:122 (+) Transcript_64710:1-366(+)
MAEPLPAGWKPATDPRSKKTYYWNEVTRETRWSRPESSAVRRVSRPAPAVQTTGTAVSKLGTGLSKLGTGLSKLQNTGRTSVRRVQLAWQQLKAEEGPGSRSAPVLGVYLGSLFLAAGMFL